MIFAVAGISLNPLIPFFWALFVGLIFSTVGAAGGILAGVGHISVFGIADANMIKPMNQLLVIVSPLIAVPVYWRQQRVVLSLGLLLGLGSIFGSVFGSWYSKNYLLEMRQYQPLFGLLVFIISLRLFYECSRRFRDRNSKVREAFKTFESKLRELKGGKGVRSKKILETSLSLRRQRINFTGYEFSLNPFWPILAGSVVGLIGSALGVGGGFLLVPYLASWLGLPMFIVAGTSALAVLVASVTSVGSYLYLGVKVDWLLAALELSGVVVGSLLGPWVSRYMRERFLRLLLAIVFLYIALGYAFGGWIKAWLGISVI
ncbi:MAG: sulfite exporter TauE/SafE family protein [Deltaproteobacteria bacterium]|nr:sulfite exporter TauE/SafE family protein [Deltaproteobacteria bacterium]